jgi:hypothetical protein
MTKFNTLKISFITLTILACYTSTSHAVPQSTIDPGWSLYASTNVTTFDTLQFTGVPIGSYNFGGAIGTKNIGNTDIILQRTGTITASGALPQTPAPSPIAITDLQLETVTPTSAFGPLAFYFLTLQSVHGGTSSTGTLTATFNTATNGTFSSSVDIFYDIRQGSLTGPIVTSGDSTVSLSGAPWQRFADNVNDVAISGVNSNLNGFSNASDFWDNGSINLSGGGFTQTLAPAVVAVPEPSSLALAALGLTGFFFLRNRRPS